MKRSEYKEAQGMKVLHDWDLTWILGEWALKRGISLLLYFISKKFPILQRINYLHENSEGIRSEQLAYMETLIKLNKICGVTPVFGIRDVVKLSFGDEIEALAIKHGVDVRHHIHIGEPPDPSRERLWDPPLIQSQETWCFDTMWIMGERVPLKEGELPIWHVDRPYNLRHYIDYLYETMVS